jgi:hypothetical protein
MRYLFIAVLCSLFTTMSIAIIVVNNNLSKDSLILYSKCVKTAKNFCNVVSEKQAKRLVKTCKVLVIHNQSINQIKNTKSCIRKVD